MKQYSSAEEYADEIYNKLYVRGKKAVNALKKKGVITKFDLDSKIMTSLLEELIKARREQLHNRQ